MGGVKLVLPVDMGMPPVGVAYQSTTVFGRLLALTCKAGIASLAHMVLSPRLAGAPGCGSASMCKVAVAVTAQLVLVIVTVYALPGAEGIGLMAAVVSPVFHLYV